MGQRQRGRVLAAAAIAAAVSVGAAPAAARAGVLSKVVHGLAARSGQPGPDAGRKASSDGHHHSDSSKSSDSGGGSVDSGGFWSGPDTPVPDTAVAGPYPLAAGPGTAVSLYLGLESVKGSDGAGAVSLRTSYGDFGIGLADTVYFESIRTKQGPDELEMHAWAMTGAWRAHRADDADDTSVWLQAGLAGTSSQGLQIFGAVVGAAVTHNLIGAIGLEGTARVFAYQDDIRALEVRGGLAVSMFRLSYRVLKYNVGPALKGPELGVAMQF